MDIHSIAGKARRIGVSCRNTMQKMIAFLKQHRLATKIVTACLVASLTVAYAAFSAGFTIGFQIRYEGHIIATVKTTDVFEDAKTIVFEKTNGRADADVIASPVFQPALRAPSDFDTADTVADAIIRNTDEIVTASAFVLDGEVLLSTQVEGLEDLLEAARTRYEVPGAANTSAFVKVPEIVTGYYLKSELADEQGVQDFILSLDVKTVSVFESETVVPFDSKTVTSASHYVGYSETTTAGVNGLTRKTETVEYRNGVEVSRASEEVQVVAPVTEVITIGSAIPQTVSQQRIVAKAAGFAFPLGDASYKVSSYFGDGRNHKGVDLCASAGTPIYAVAAGTVVSSKYDGNYGNCVIVDHGNGIKTRYAHASRLCVQVGTVVEQGDLLALVGTTGQSYGNHLHFEVILNGRAVDPAPYIGV